VKIVEFVEIMKASNSLSTAKSTAICSIDSIRLFFSRILNGVKISSNVARFICLIVKLSKTNIIESLITSVAISFYPKLSISASSS